MGTREVVSPRHQCFISRFHYIEINLCADSHKVPFIFFTIARRTDELKLLRRRRDVAAMREVFNVAHEDETEEDRDNMEFEDLYEPQEHKYIKRLIKR